MRAIKRTDAYVLPSFFPDGEASPDLATRFVELSAQLDALVADSGNQGESLTAGFQDHATR